MNAVHPRQQGVAIVTALLLTALAITLVMSLFGQQNIQVRSIENQRYQLQKRWIIRGALDWARLILREDGKIGKADYLGEPWSVPLEEVRLDSFVDNGRGTDEDSDATLSGYIIDAQSRLNLTNLAYFGRIDNEYVKAFERLLDAQGLDAGLAATTAAVVASSQVHFANPSVNGSIPTDPIPAKLLRLTQVDDLLAIPGFDQTAVNKLKDLVVFLPVPTPININTASAQVISARIAGVSISDAQQIVTARDRAYFRDMSDLNGRWRFGSAPLPAATMVNTRTSYFIVHGHVRLGRSILDQDTLIERRPSGGPTRIIWVRES